jgi:hypothetical protein
MHTCLQLSGTLVVLLELALLEVVKFAVIYFLFNIGYALAFEVLLRGISSDPDQTDQGSVLPNIGMAMIQLLR